jgi:hypothetical protein
MFLCVVSCPERVQCFAARQDDFPGEKVCGDGITAAFSTLLEEMGVMDFIRLRHLFFDTGYHGCQCCFLQAVNQIMSNNEITFNPGLTE